MKKKSLMSNAERRKRDILKYVTYAERNGVVPSVREICSGVGIPSTATVHSYLKKLEEEGRIFSLPDGKKTVRLLADQPRFGVFPLISGTAHGGDFFHPSKIIATLTCDDGRGDGLFGFKQTSGGLAERGILNGDVLVCEKTPSVKDGDIAVYENGGRLCAAVFSTLGGSFLLSDGKGDTEANEVRIIGRVVQIRRSILTADE